MRHRPILLLAASLSGLAAHAAAAEEAGTCPDKAPADLVTLDSPDGTLTATIAPDLRSRPLAVLPRDVVNAG